MKRPVANPKGIYKRKLKYTAQEMRLVRLFQRGLTDAECAKVMQRSRYTVRDKKRSLMNKLDANSKREIVRNALRRGLVAP